MSSYMNVVANNIPGMFSQRQLGITNSNKAKSTEKLSSGYRINRAADDAAGLTISEKMRRQIRGLTQGIKNAQDGVSMCQIADGALEEVSDMLHRLTELTVKSSNGTNYAEDRQAIQDEVNNLLQEIDRVSDTTTFNEQMIFAQKTNEAETSSIEYDDSINKYGLKFAEAKKSLLDGTYRTVPASGFLGNCDSDEANHLIKNLSTAAIAADIAVYYTKLMDSDMSEMDKVGRLYDKEKSYIPVVYNNFNTDRIFNIYHTTLTEESQLNFNTANSYLLKGKNSDTEYNASVFYAGAENLYKKVNDGRSYGPYLKMAKGMESYAKSMKVLSGRLQNPSQSPGSISNGVSFCRYTLESIKSQQPFTYAGEGGYLKSVTRGYLDTAYSSLFENPTDNTGFNNKATSDTLDQIVFAYMSLFDDLNDELNNISSDENELKKKCNEFWIQSGAEPDDGIMLEFGIMNADVMGISGLNVSTQTSAQRAIEKVKDAQSYVSALRSDIGAQQNRLEHTIKNQNNIVENTQTAESRIRDTDMADEMVKYSKENILQQVGQSMLAQSNQSRQGLLTLLQ